mgnify:CR=1 FL=1|jgi:CyaY protein
MDEQAFQTHADHALERLFRKLSLASDTYGFEADFNNGALTVEFEEPPGKFVVSPNSPVRQIWVSALTKSFKLDWDEASGSFVLPATGQTLEALMADVIGKQLNDTIEL